MSSGQSTGEYTVVLDTDESAFAPYTLTTANFANKIITLRGGAYDTVKLSDYGSLFTMQSGVSLVLRDITLPGKGPHDFNDQAPVTLDGSVLTMEAGSLITGNRNFSSPAKDRGVFAKNDAIITINGGSIDETS
jgi:hypothetical protein